MKAYRSDRSVRGLKVLLAVLAFSWVIMASSSISTADVNIRTEIAGVRIGMSSGVASERLRQRGIAATSSMQPCVRDYLETRKKGKSLDDSPRNCVTSLTARVGSEALLVNFVEDFPRNANSSVVVSIAVNSFDNKSFPSGSALAGDVVRRLGHPTLTDGKSPWSIALWCAGTCTSIKHTLQSTAAPLYLCLRRGSSGGLSLVDERYDFQRESAVRKFLAAHGIVL